MSEPETLCQRPPAFQSYARDEILRTRFRTDRQVGWICRLEWESWVYLEWAFLPDDPNILQQMAGAAAIPSALLGASLSADTRASYHEKFEKEWAEVYAMMTVRKTVNGQPFVGFDWLVLQRQKMEGNREKKSLAGQASAVARFGKTWNESNPDADRSKTGRVMLTFPRFQELYPKKWPFAGATLFQAEAAFVKAVNISDAAGESIETMLERIGKDLKRRLAEAGQWHGKQFQFIPKPASYLDQRLWEAMTAPDKPKDIEDVIAMKRRKP